MSPQREVSKRKEIGKLHRKSLSGSIRREQALLQGKIKPVLVHAPALFAEALPGCLLFQAGGTDPC